MLNSVNLQGRLVKDAELKSTQSGISVASFSIAVQSRRKDSGGNYISYFINCVAWRGLSDFISKYFHKGDMIIISGELTTRSYEGNNGKRYITEVIVNEANFGGGKAENKQEVSADPFEQELGDLIDLGDMDNLPF